MCVFVHIKNCENIILMLEKQFIFTIYFYVVSYTSNNFEMLSAAKLKQSIKGLKFIDVNVYFSIC